MKSSVRTGGTVSLSVDAWQSDYVTILSNGHVMRTLVGAYKLKIQLWIQMSEKVVLSIVTCVKCDVMYSMCVCVFDTCV